jgi:hypothetical protein
MALGALCACGAALAFWHWARHEAANPVADQSAIPVEAL